MKRLSILLLLISAATGAQAQDLVILHTNDTHSQIEPFRSGINNGLAGVERRLQFINSQIEEYGKDHVLLLDAGDYNQGTPYFTLGKGDLEANLMNLLGYEAATLGNHEFDNGLDELARRLRITGFPTLCANYDFSETPIGELVQPYTIISKAGIKIGIIGLTTRLDRVVSYNIVKDLVWLDPIEAVNRYARELKEDEQCDMVIVLSHLGYREDDNDNYDAPSDITLAKHTRNVDIIIGGHSHTFLKEMKKFRNLDGKEVSIVQDGAYGVYVGKLSINFN